MKSLFTKAKTLHEKKNQTRENKIKQNKKEEEKQKNEKTKKKRTKSETSNYLATFILNTKTCFVRATIVAKQSAAHQIAEQNDSNRRLIDSLSNVICVKCAQYEQLWCFIVTAISPHEYTIHRIVSEFYLFKSKQFNRRHSKLRKTYIFRILFCLLCICWVAVIRQFW